MQVYGAAQLNSPVLLSVEILTRMSLAAQWNHRDANGRVAVDEERRFAFPPMEIGDATADVDGIIRPICDHIHQMFGRERSFCFDANGRWSDPRL